MEKALRSLQSSKMKILVYVLACFILFPSCKQSNIIEHKSSFRDSVLNAYVLHLDSLIKLDGSYFKDSNDYNYKLIKAFNLNDTTYLRSVMKGIDWSRQNMLY